jgi:membrane-associated protease RseP (regulator of RpoE activity)
MMIFTLIGALLVVPPTGPAQAADPEREAAAAVRRALGVEFNVLESKVRRSIIRTATPYGLKIGTVDKDSPAARAGWQAGDILLEWNAQPVRSLTQLRDALATNGAAAPFKLARYKKDVSVWSRQPWQYVEGKVGANGAGPPRAPGAKTPN